MGRVAKWLIDDRAEGRVNIFRGRRHAGQFSGDRDAHIGFRENHGSSGNTSTITEVVG